MKRLSIAFALTVSLLLTSGCIDKYLEDIEELERRLDAIEQLCDEMNVNIRSLQVIVSSIQDKDMISGVTSITQSGKEVGYKINFVKTAPITIYHGTNGKVPLIGTAKDTDGNYYWNIKYDDGTVGWITDDYGQKVLAMGIAPYVRVRNDRWMISYDGGTSWTDLGQATGEDGDSMFKSINTTNPNYVIITLTNGTVFKIPVYEQYLALKTEAGKINSNANALETIIRTIASQVVYIEDAGSIMENGKRVGTYFELSNGESFKVYDWQGSNAPTIMPVLDSINGIYYWTFQYNDEEIKWLLDTDGNRIRSVGDTIAPPKIGLEMDDNGNFFWTIQYAGETITTIKDSEGYAPPAIKNSTSSIFKKVDLSDPDFVLFVTWDGTEYRMPKEFSISLLTTVSMAVKSTMHLTYTVYGAKYSDVSAAFITQGGFKAYLSSVPGFIIIESPNDFTPEQGKILAVFTIKNSQKSSVKTITVNKL
ncbi:MAG: hypothetical protein GXY75_04280 [Bacteroidales bacterium]|jgi:uncharacterized protein YegP (UPF0339 family)|nr:hypothetical protein [Bacteroidales bacterium]